MKSDYTDFEIVEAIAKGGQQMEFAMRFIYQEGSFQQAVFSFVENNKGNRQDAEDIFQDGIAHFVMNIRKGNFRGDSNVKTYLIAICKNLWFNRLRRSATLSAIKEEIQIAETTDNSPEKIFLFKERADFAKTMLEKLGDPCRKILSLWGLHYSMKEIVQQTNYKNEGVVRKKKHQCMQKLMAIVETSKTHI